MKTILTILLYCFGFHVSAQYYDVIFDSIITSNQGGFNVTLEYQDWFGYAVEDIDDLNGDGVNDLAVGVLKDDDGGFNRGAVYILFMNNDGAINGYQKISDTEGGFEGFLEDWDILGTSLSYLGDIDNDGLVELAIGAEYDGDGGYRKGAVYIVSLESDGTVADHIKISDTQGNFNAPLDVWDVFGSDIELLGDLNGDGNQDIAVGARRDGDGGSEKGALYILFLNANLTVNSYQKISDTEGGFNAVLDSQDYFGGSVVNIGDLDGDGVIDLAVGAYRDDDGGYDKGAVYILFLNSDGTVKDYSKISATSGELGVDLTPGSRFGRSIDVAPDLNEDGFIDLIISAYGYQMEGNAYGAFVLANINEIGQVVSTEFYTKDSNYFSGELEDGDAFGFSVTYNGNLDGVPAIVVGTFLDDVQSFDEGSIYIIKLGERLSVEEIQNDTALFVYPNPANLHFRINNITGISSVRIYSAQGTVAGYFENPLPDTFDVSYLSTGTYLVDIRNDEGVITVARLIVE